MAETENIARMAEKLSTEIFAVFGWQRVGPMNQNWSCTVPDEHFKKPSDKKTHPTDVVFRFSHPYRSVVVHLNTDLKSYAKGSITKASVAGALRTLAHAVHCANASEEWQAQYTTSTETAEIAGLLFVYNHDGDFDGDFENLLNEADKKAISPTRTQKLFVLGPRRIAYLATVANDIMWLRGSQAVPGPPRFWYYYPDLITVRTREERPAAATLEALLGPLLVARYERVDGTDVKQGALIYYARKGETVDEFKYLIDYLFRYQLLVTLDEVKVRLPDGAPKSPSVFQQAVEAYVADLHGLPEIRKRLERVSVATVTNVVTRFSEVEIGMER